MSGEFLVDLVSRKWWGAVGTVARLVGDVAVTDDAVQEACVAALRQLPRGGVQENLGGSLIGTAHHSACDWLRDEARRSEQEEEEAILEAFGRRDVAERSDLVADKLPLIVTWCPPTVDPGVRVPPTLPAVRGPSTAQIAAVFLLPEPTMAQRLVRAKRKIRQAGIPLLGPAPAGLPGRIADVLQVVHSFPRSSWTMGL